MKKACIIFAAIIALLFSSGLSAEVLGVYETDSGTGWLERSDSGYLVLHLEGSWYDMGYQQGKLMEDECRITINGVKGLVWHYIPFAPFKLIERLLYEIYWKREEPFVPQEFKDELRGLSDATGYTLKDIQGLHSVIFLASCSGTAAYGPATKDGELYQTRSLDFAMGFIDPKTKTPMHDQAILAVYKPKDGVPFVSFTWPGFLGSVGGMNAQGISVSEMTDASKYEKAAGLPMIWRIKQTLAKADNLDEAMELMLESPLEGGYNFLVGDGRIPDAVAIEMDAEKAYYASSFCATEQSGYEYKGKTYVYTPKPGLILRTNHPISRMLIENHKGGIDGSAARYSDLLERHLARYGEIDLELIMEIQREHYTSRCENDLKDMGCSQTIYQAAMAPKSGDFLVSSAQGDLYELGAGAASAYNQPVHRFNLFELIEREP